MNAGVIEGFFGKPWDWAARLATVDFLRDSGYRFYLYAPKADPFLRRRWREPMPEETLRRLSELRAHGTEQGISIGVGLTPFEIYLNYDSGARAALRAKVEQINAAGIHVLCVLFDDMRGDVAGLPSLQARVVADISAWSNARHFIVCPTYYSYDARLAKEFGSAPKRYLRDLGRQLDPRIDIFWTGEKVISDGYSAEHLVEVASQLRRKPFIWDNSISNDSKLRANRLYLDPFQGAWELPVDLVAGLAINPMKQAYLSRIALCRFQQRLANESTGAASPVTRDYCRKLFEPVFTAELEQDIRLTQDIGLPEMDTDTRRRLLARYEPLASNPYARELSAWLRKEYEFDPECLTS